MLGHGICVFRSGVCLVGRSSLICSEERLEIWNAYGRYRLVGDCYLQGIMDGEVVDSVAVALKVRTVVLE